MSGEFDFPEGVRAIRVRRKNDVLEAYSKNGDDLDEGVPVRSRMIREAEYRRGLGALRELKRRTCGESAVEFAFRELRGIAKEFGGTVSEFTKIFRR